MIKTIVQKLFRKKLSNQDPLNMAQKYRDWCSDRRKYIYLS